MSAIDRAFIRAYEPATAPTDDAAATTAAIEGSSALRVDSPSEPASSLPSPPNFNVESSSLFVFADGLFQERNPPVLAREPEANVPAEAEAALASRSPEVDAATMSGPRLQVNQDVDEDARESQVSQSERRPLSDFIQTEPADATFRPALEVDQFAWSSTVRDLAERDPAIWRQALETLMQARDEGRTLIGVAGAERQSGCTSTLACLAMMLAREGLSIAMVDGNFQHPDLARHLGVAPELGWEDVLAGRLPLAEAAVHSVEDDAMLLPLLQGGGDAAPQLGGPHAASAAGMLRYHYDVALFDLGAMADSAQRQWSRHIVQNCRLDAAILILRELDADWAVCERLAQTSPELAEICLGAVQRNARGI